MVEKHDFFDPAWQFIAFSYLNNFLYTEGREAVVAVNKIKYNSCYKILYIESWILQDNKNRLKSIVLLIKMLSLTIYNYNKKSFSFTSDLQVHIYNNLFYRYWLPRYPGTTLPYCLTNGWLHFHIYMYIETMEDPRGLHRFSMFLTFDKSEKKIIKI